jgi:hypothetical protein
LLGGIDNHDRWRGYLDDDPRDRADRGGPWQQSLWLAACDLHGCGEPIDSTLPYLLEAADASASSDRLEAALGVIANAYGEPRLPARQHMERKAAERSRESGRDGGDPGRQGKSPASQHRPEQAGGRPGR